MIELGICYEMYINLLKIIIAETKADKAEIRITDLSGNELQSTRRELTNGMDLSGIPVGAYTLVARVGSMVLTQRVAVVR